MSIKSRISKAWEAARRAWDDTPMDVPMNPDWAEDSAPAFGPASEIRPPQGNADFDPEELMKTVMAVPDGEKPKGHEWLMDQIAAEKAVVDRGYIYEARCHNRTGKILKEAKSDGKNKELNDLKDYRIVPVRGHAQFMAEVERSKKMQALREDAFGQDLNPNIFGPYDPNQYTEYAPILGGYFYAQQYLYDLLKGYAYAFEAWNHNPLAHRIINAISQYAMGRRFDWSVDDPKKEEVWEKFAETIHLRQRMSKFWSKEKLIFGEIFVNTKKWCTLHPGTIWEIVTDPDDFYDVYYYYRSYPTAYQLYTGSKVLGAPGSEKVPAQRYVIEQLPYNQVIHMTSQCTSFEKRGRSILFPILGWLKRIKDIYNNQAIREQMLADYVWDVTIKGGPSDVAKYAQQYTPLARAGSTHFHNEAVERKPMVASAGAGRGQTEASNNILAFIATAIGLPKDFFNVIAASGGNRATALVAAEPFTKVIEDEQADQEYLLHVIAKNVFEQAGLGYSKDDIEFTFPSVAKDTTSETVKNIMLGEMQGYISKERAAGLYTQEMNVTAYDFEQEQEDIKNEKAQGISGVGMPMPGMGQTGPDGVVSDGESPIHGDGAVDTKDQMNTL